MRIVAGAAKGRPLLGPKSLTIRPTADRVRESIFNILGQALEGCTVLDLFAGTGAMALESLSRGAMNAVLVDSNRQAIRLCRANAEGLGFSERVELLEMSTERALKALVRQRRRFDLVFADPPYRAGMASKILEQLGTSDLLEPGGRACIERDKREEVPEVGGLLRRFDERRFGDTLVTFYRSS